MTTYKAYRVTDGANELYLTAESRAKATGAFIRHFGRRIAWKQLRTTRERALDGDEAFCYDPGEHATAEYWGVPVELS
jgi:hypothetical protein